MITARRTLRTLSLLSLAWLALGVTASAAPACWAPPNAGAADCEGALYDVVAEGAGSNAQEARKDALRAAVSQVVGTLVVASDMVKNESLIESKVLTYSDGYVKEHKVLGDPVTRGGLTRLKIQARVCVSKLTAVLKANAIKVREIDLHSIQGESETKDQQNRSATEIAAQVFKGFPSVLLKAEPLKEVRVSGDAQESVVEIPVRVQVDMQKWAAWVQQARRLLDRIAEEKGTERWNTKVAGWQPLRSSSAKPKKDKSGRAPADEQAICWVGSRYWTRRFVPDAERKNAAVFLEAPDARESPNILAQKRRVVAILDSMGGQIYWWKFSQEVYEVVIKSFVSPTIDVQISDPTGSAIGTSIVNWTEVVESDRPGERDTTVISGEGIGSRSLRVGENEGASFRCIWAFKDGVLLMPCGALDRNIGEIFSGFSGTVTRCRVQVTLTPTMVFPFRFRVPADQLSQATKQAVKVTLGPESDAVSSKADSDG